MPKTPVCASLEAVDTRFAKRRRRIGALALIAAATAATDTRAADQMLRLRVGEETTIELQENPSTGYRWTIDNATSSNLPLLTINDRGFSQGGGSKPLLGAPGIHRWSVTASRPGSATISFTYRRPWERESIRTHQVTVEAAP